MRAQPLDPRIRRSRAALETALRELIAQRSLSQISVSDVTKRAGVNRSTFYEHYTDVHDLAAAACTALFDELVAAAPASLSPRMPEGRLAVNPLSRLFAHVAEHAELYRVLLGSSGSARVINHLLQRIAFAVHLRSTCATTAMPQTSDQPAIPHDPSAAFVAGAVLGSVIDWLDRGCPGTPDRMGDVLLPQLAALASAMGLGKQPAGPAPE